MDSNHMMDTVLVELAGLLHLRLLGLLLRYSCNCIRRTFFYLPYGF